MKYYIKYVIIPKYDESIMSFVEYTPPYIPQLNSTVILPGLGTYTVKSVITTLDREITITVFLETK